MLDLLPAPLHRAALRLAHWVRLRWWRLAGRALHGCNVVVCDSGGAVLLVRHSYQSPERWMLPGGGLRRGESAEIAARREVVEETGCRVTDPREFAVDIEALAGCRNHVHLVAASTADEPRADRREVIEARFFAPDELPPNVSANAEARIMRWQEWRSGRSGQPD